jgi:hypothetical protein
MVIDFLIRLVVRGTGRRGSRKVVTLKIKLHLHIVKEKLPYSFESDAKGVGEVSCMEENY